MERDLGLKAAAGSVAAAAAAGAGPVLGDQEEAPQEVLHVALTGSEQAAHTAAHSTAADLAAVLRVPDGRSMEAVRQWDHFAVDSILDFAAAAIAAAAVEVA